jgi:hypothetical protein
MQRINHVNSGTFCNRTGANASASDLQLSIEETMITLAPMLLVLAAPIVWPGVLLFLPA